MGRNLVETFQALRREIRRLNRSDEDKRKNIKLKILSALKNMRLTERQTRILLEELKGETK